MSVKVSRNGRVDLIQRFVAAGVDVNAREKLRGTTALMWATEQHHPDAVKALLAAGANPGIASGPAGLPQNYMAPRTNVRAVEESKARRERAVAAGRTYEEQLAFERSQQPPAPPRGQGGRGGGQAQAGFPGQPPPEDLIQAGLVGSGGGGLTALTFAAREGDIDSARALLDGGADVNQTTEYGWTPLLTAINNRNYALASLLIDRGADVNRPNKGGWTPLYIATDTGVQVCDQQGRLSTVIPPPATKGLTNVRFAGRNLDWIYITDGERWYRRLRHSLNLPHQK